MVLGLSLFEGMMMERELKERSVQGEGRKIEKERERLKKLKERENTTK
jgi:hypothetical protein